MIDMMGNVNDLMNIVQQLRTNPMQLLSKRFNIPQNIDTSNPNTIIQHLLNSGQVTQDQVNRAMQVKNNPMLKQYFK